ncbi:MAG TPA: XRE family transcriptional regulator [Spirochaeta sp.]|nr:XRE family transcriptional regulator [Spirochaeta sp.]
MLAVVKKPHIEISAEMIPAELISFLEEHYENIEIINDEEALIDITETKWYQNIAKSSTPGKTLKRYRKRAGMSQPKLAAKLGMVKQNVSAMENGSRGISKATAHKLAEIFQVSPGRFI